MATNCNQYFNHCRTCLSELDENKVYMYKDDNISKMLSQCTSIQISVEDQLMQHMCNICYQTLITLYTFKEKSEYVDNLLRELNTESDKLIKTDVDVNPEANVLSEFTCTLCKKTFTRNASLQIHLERHKKTRIHKCGLCPKSFKTKQDLKVHLSRHANNKLLKCDTCNKIFSSKSAIIKHIKTHSLQKAYLCSFCGKGFHVFDTLKTHLKIHTKENLLGCEICKQKFAARASLNLHLKKHTGEAQYLCSLCGFLFKTASELKQHEVRHRVR